MRLCAQGGREFGREVDHRVVGRDDDLRGRGLLGGGAEVGAGGVGGGRGVDEVVGRGEVGLERNVGLLVLIFPGVAVAVADVHADD